MPSRDSSKPHVLILGAGLGGLALAQALRKQGVSFEIFERDDGLHARFQGWAIALHFIVADMKASFPEDMPDIETTNHLLPLEDVYPSMALFKGDGSKLADVRSTKENSLLRANRSRLRDWLSTNLNIKYGTHMTRIEEHGDSVTLHFKDGSTATGDVLVGADGIHSHVRHHLLEGKDHLNAIPQGILVGELTLTKEQYKRQMDIAHSAYVVLDPKVHLFVGLNSISADASTGKYYWILGWPDEEAAHEPFWTQSKGKQELYDYALDRAKELPADLSEAVRLTDPDGMMVPPMVIRDMILTELPNRHITLLGDAAHPMTPFRGEGGNNALQDSLHLARALGKSNHDNLLANLKEYQNEMLDRGSKAVNLSRHAQENLGAGTQRAWQNWTTGHNEAAKHA